MAKPAGHGRGWVKHPELHTAGIGHGGTRSPHLNPNFEVLHQNEPTPEHPISQHKQFKGHSTSVAHGKIAK
jgi:hypothetical protein